MGLTGQFSFYYPGVNAWARETQHAKLGDYRRRRTRNKMRIAWKILKALFLLFALLFLVAQIIRPSRANPPVDESQTIQDRTQMTPEVAAIFERSCRDCHSNKTVWPWYTNVAPISWWLSNHVNEGRQNLNLSEWGKLPPDRQDRKLRQ